jgi:non-ribosomal peptide synthetase component E (peptide arylation enzyme)
MRAIKYIQIPFFSSYIWMVAQAKDRFPPPSLLLIQVGSNNLTEIKSVDLVDNITSDILRIKLLFPNAN